MRKFILALIFSIIACSTVALGLGVYGELKAALFEKLGSDPSNTEARVYYNTAVDMPKYYDGVAWRFLAPRGFESINAVSADYTVLDNDGYNTIAVTTSTTNRTVTLPTAADNTGRVLKIVKIDNASGKVIVDGESTEAVGTGTTFDLHIINDYVTLQCNGTKWLVISQRDISAWQSVTPVFAASTLGTLAASTASWQRRGSHIFYQGTVTASGTIGGSNLTLTLPVLGSAAAAAVVATTHASGQLVGRWIRGTNSATTRKGGNIFVIGNASNNFVYFSSDDYTAAVNPFTAVAADALITASNVISFEFEVAVTDFAHWGG